jgi:tRNA threonylcarbamoyladenosine biosynthesis protein TsaE
MPESKILFDDVIKNAEQMHELGIKLSKELQAGDLVLLTGLLGAGKTTLARGIGEGLAVEGTVSSPTFVIARTHKRAGAPLVHVDAYRLKSAVELDDLDIPFNEAIVLVEWGKGLTEDLADSWLEVNIERDSSGLTEDRQVTITAFGERFMQVKM